MQRQPRKRQRHHPLHRRPRSLPARWRRRPAPGISFPHFLLPLKQRLPCPGCLLRSLSLQLLLQCLRRPAARVRRRPRWATVSHPIRCPSARCGRYRRRLPTSMQLLRRWLRYTQPWRGSPLVRPSHRARRTPIRCSPFSMRLRTRFLRRHWHPLRQQLLRRHCQNLSWHRWPPLPLPSLLRASFPLPLPALL